MCRLRCDATCQNQALPVNDFASIAEQIATQNVSVVTQKTPFATQLRVFSVHSKKKMLCKIAAQNCIPASCRNSKLG